jgi:hypothetical protein
MPSERRRVDYKIIHMKDGTYAVQASSGPGNPLTISGFKTEDDAKAWINAQGGHDSDLNGESQSTE